jgi:type IV pilus assembly protein PilW
MITKPGYQQGLTLVETLVTLALSCALLGLLGHGYFSLKQTLRITSELATLRESGRHALDTLSHDLKRAGYYAEARTNPGPLIIAGLGSSQQRCSRHSEWGTTLQEPVFALDDTNRRGNADYQPCISNGDYLRGDIITLRFAGPVGTDAWRSSDNDKRPYLVAALQTPGVVAGAEVAKTRDAVSPPPQVYEVVAHAYYLTAALGEAHDCAAGNVPALARKTLDDNGLPRAEELVQGIEHLEIQLGLDSDADGAVDRYVDPGADVAWEQVRAARIWVLARALCPEAGYRDTHRYPLGNQIWQPNDAYRRELLVTTVALRGLSGVSTQ